MYEVGVSREVKAWHVMPEMEGPEGELHAHNYRIEVTITGAELDGGGFVVDIDVAEAALDRIGAEVDDRNLGEVVVGDEAVTVERFARWTHDRVREALTLPPRGGLHVRIWESPVAFGGYSSPG